MKSRDFLLISIPIISVGSTSNSIASENQKKCEEIFLENAISEKIEKLFSQKMPGNSLLETPTRRTERLKFRRVWELHLASKEERIIPSGDGKAAIRIEPNGNVNVIDVETSNDYPLYFNNFITKIRDLEITAFHKFGGRLLITQQNSEGRFVHSWLQLQNYQPGQKPIARLISDRPLTERSQIGTDSVLSLLTEEQDKGYLEPLMIFDHGTQKISKRMETDRANVTFDLRLTPQYAAFINEKFELVLWDHVRNTVIFRKPTGIHPLSIPNMDTRMDNNLDYRWVHDGEAIAIANGNTFELRETKTGRILKQMRFESEMTNLFSSEISDHYGFQLQDTLLIYRHSSNKAPVTIAVRPLVKAAVDLFESTEVLFLSPRTLLLQSPSYRLFFDLQSGLNITTQYSELPMDLFFISENVAKSITNQKYQIWIQH